MSLHEVIPLTIMSRIKNRSKNVPTKLFSFALKSFFVELFQLSCRKVNKRLKKQVRKITMQNKFNSCTVH